MASTIKRRVALKGQSRSKFCGEPIKSGSKTPCLRLAGHKKAHRATTLRVQRAPKVVADTFVAEVTVTEGEIEVTPIIVPEPSALTQVVRQVKARRARKTRRGRRLSPTAVSAIATAVEDGTMSAGDALSAVAASQRGKVNRVVEAATV